MLVADIRCALIACAAALVAALMPSVAMAQAYPSRPTYLELQSGGIRCAPGATCDGGVLKVTPPNTAAETLTSLLRFTPRISSGVVSLLNGPTLGLWQDGKWTSTPDTVRVPGIGGATAAQIDAEAATPVDVPTYGLTATSGWKARQWLRRTAPAGTVSAPRTYSYLGQNIFLEAPGSGRNGPTSADYALNTTVFKSGFPAATSGVGEIDGQQIVVRQSGPTPTTQDNASDASGDLRNVQMAGDPGFVAAAEWLTTRIDATTPFALTHAVTTQIGVVDPFGKNAEQGLPRYGSINRLGFGYFAGANTGNLDRAFYSIGNGATGCWEDHAYFGAPGAPAFRVKGACSGATLDGTIVFGPDGGNKISLQRDTAGNLLFLDKTNTTKAAIRQDGAVTVAANDGKIVLGPDSGSVTLAKDAQNRLTVQSTGSAAGVVQTVPGAWLTYTPTVSSSGGGAVGSFTTEGAYQVIGKRLDLRARVSITSVGGATGNLTVNLPPGFTTAGGPICVGTGRENAAGKSLAPFVGIGSSTITVVDYANATVLTNGAVAHINLSCEIQ